MFEVSLGQHMGLRMCLHYTLANIKEEGFVPKHGVLMEIIREPKASQCHTGPWHSHHLSDTFQGNYMPSLLKFACVNGTTQFLLIYLMCLCLRSLLSLNSYYYI